MHESVADPQTSPGAGREPGESAVIVADDLSGALDTAAQWARLGVQVTVRRAASAGDRAPVCALNTRSRERSPAQAYRRVRAVFERLGARVVYKKIDSTFRGPVAAELRAALDSGAADRLLVAPAFPDQGRWVLEGRLVVRGARRSASPLDLLSLLRTDLGEPVELLDHAQVTDGVAATARRLNQTGARVILADADSNDDLETVAQSLWLSGGRVLPVGSAGLARPVAALWAGRGAQVVPPIELPQNGEPALLLLGTYHETTVAQLRQLGAWNGVEVLSAQTRRLSSEEGFLSEQRRLSERAAEAMAAGRSVALATGLVGFVRGCSLRPVRLLGAVNLSLLAHQRVRLLMISGGDTCYEVLRQMRATHLQVVGEAQPGIPWSRVGDGPHAGLALITKSGGFGDPAALVRLLGGRDAG